MNNMNMNTAMELAPAAITEFFGRIKDAVERELGDVTAEITTVEKLGASYNALMVRPNSSNVGVNLNLDAFWGAIVGGNLTVEEAEEKAVEVVTNALAEAPDTNGLLEDMNNYETAKEHFTVALVGKSQAKNAEVLEGCPYEDFAGDLALVVRYVVPGMDQDGGRGTVLIRNENLERWGIDKETLFADAKESAQKIDPIEVKTMTETMIEMMGADNAEMMGITAGNGEDEKMFVISNSHKLNGAGCVAYPSFYEAVKAKSGMEEFYILPSSVHELLAVRPGEMDKEALAEMVANVNDTQVAPDEVLSSEVYYCNADGFVRVA